MLSGAFAAGLLLALGQTQWEAGLRAEARVYRQADADLLLQPDLAIEDRARDLVLRARYAPQLLLREPSSRGTFNALHVEELSAALRVDRDTSLTLVQSGSIGASDLSWIALAPSAAPFMGVQRDQAQPLSFVNAGATVTLEQRLSNRLTLGANAGFGVTGALDQKDLAAYPRTDAVRGGAGVTWREPRDTLTVGAGGSYGWVTGGYDTNYVGGNVAWRHAFTVASERAMTASVVDAPDETLGPRYETELRAGFARFGGDAPNQQQGEIPTGEASLFREAPRRPGAVAARVTLRYAPVIDAATGAFIARGEASVQVDLRIDRRFVATAAGGVGYAPDAGPGVPATLGQEGLALTYEAARDIAISVGGRVAHIPQTEWAGIVTATFMERGRF